MVNRLRLCLPGKTRSILSTQVCGNDVDIGLYKWRGPVMRTPSLHVDGYLGPFSIAYLEAQVPWNFTYKSGTWRFLSSIQETWNPRHLAKSHVTSAADLQISLATLASLFIFCIFVNPYMWYYMVCFTTHVQKAVSILFIGKLCVIGIDTNIGVMVVS